MSKIVFGRERAMAPVYGMASTIPMRGLVSDMLKKYLDLIFNS